MSGDPRRDLNLIVFLSNRCNLQCGYCAVEVNRGEALRLDAARLRRGIARYLDETSGRKSVTLLGGEPLLDPVLVELAVDAAREEAAARGEEARVSVYTNGTLLTPELVSSLRSRDVAVWLSLDGRARTNDAHRTYRSGGRSVFADVERRLAGIDARQLRANMVLHAATIRDLTRDADWFQRRGFPVVNFHPELWEPWAPSALRALKESLDEFSRWYRAKWRSLGRPPFELPIVSLTLDHAPRREDPAPWWERCENLVLGPDGRFRACERDLADDLALSAERVVGDPEAGVDWDKREALLASPRALLRRRGAAGRWHHACPKGLATLAERRGWDPERVLDSFQAVSREFGEGLRAMAADMRGLPGFAELYPGAAALRPARARRPAPGALDRHLDAGRSIEAAAAHGFGAAAITRFWEADARDSRGLARLWRRLEPAAPGKSPAQPGDLASRLVLRGLSRLRPDAGGRADALAVADWEAALEEDPACAWAEHLLGVAAFQERRFEEALSRFGFATALRPDHAWTRVLRAWTSHLLGRQDEAAAGLKEAARLEPGSPWPDALLASVEYSADPRAMTRRLARAARLRRAPWTRAWLGYARLRERSAALAAADLDRALARDPAFDRAWVWRGEAALAREDASGAEAAASRSISLSPTMPTAFLTRARARLFRGDARGGLRDLEAMARLNRRYEWESNRFNVRYLQEERDWRAADAALADAERALPRAALVPLLRGCSALVRRDYPGASRLLAEAESRGVSVEWRPWSRLWIGLALSRLDRARDAAAALEGAVGAASAWGLSARSRLSLGLGKPDEALALAERAVAADGRLSDAWLALAAARLSRGDEAGALAAIERHSALEPMMAWSREWRGRLAARLGRWRDAFDALAALERPSGAAARVLEAARRRAFGPGVLPDGPDPALEASLSEEDFAWVLDDCSPAPARTEDAAPDRFPRQSGPFLVRGRDAAARGDFARALEQARWAVEESVCAPWSEEALLLEARALSALGRGAEASARLTFLSRLVPASPWPRALAARAAFAEGDAARARRGLGLALSAAPRNARLRAAASALLEREPALRGAP